jgi:hypothetical protein
LVKAFSETDFTEGLKKIDLLRTKNGLDFGIHPIAE